VDCIAKIKFLLHQNHKSEDCVLTTRKINARSSHTTNKSNHYLKKKKKKQNKKHHAALKSIFLLLEE